MKTVILIPAHNEAKAIGPLVKTVRGLGHEVVVIDDGSTDATSVLAGAEGATVLKTPTRSGKGGALKFGFAHCLKSNVDAVIVLDGDGQHAPSDLASFLICQEKTKADVVTGNRMHNPKGMPLVRWLTNRFMSGMISLICRQSIPDTQCGYRLMTTTLLKSITLECSDFEIETEILIKASKKGFKIASVPIQTIYRDEVSKIRPVKDTMRFMAYISREIFRR